ncbi:hypothetical protein Tco_1159067 [Tanacetum coccineum]
MVGVNINLTSGLPFSFIDCLCLILSSYADLDKPEESATDPSDMPGLKRSSFPVYAEDIDACVDSSPSTTMLSEVARSLKIAIVGGSPRNQEANDFRACLGLRPTGDMGHERFMNVYWHEEIVNRKLAALKGLDARLKEIRGYLDLVIDGKLPLNR